MTKMSEEFYARLRNVLTDFLLTADSLSSELMSTTDINLHIQYIVAKVVKAQKELASVIYFFNSSVELTNIVDRDLAESIKAIRDELDKMEKWGRIP